MAQHASKKYYTPAEALARLQRYCALQERSHNEVRSKLLSCGLRGNDLENVITNLIEAGFLNEERFAAAYAGGKFRMKHWGKKKIEQQLKAKGVSRYCINKALLEIDEGDYQKSMLALLKKKAALLKDSNLFARRQKLSTFLIRKGYESDAVYAAVTKFYGGE